MTESHPAADLGLGLGARPALFAGLLEQNSGLGFLEVTTEDFLDAEGQRRQVLYDLAARYPIVMHGLSLSIAGSDALNINYLARLRNLADEIGARWVSDHLGWTGIDGVQIDELLPIPLTSSSLAHVSSRIHIAQDVLGRSIVLENLSAYLAFDESTMSEPEFLSRLVENTGCRILLDVNNVYVSGSNLGLDPVEYIDALPVDAVAQIHLGGHRNMGAYLLDSHDERVSAPVWDLYRQASRRLGPVSTSLEWDTRLPRLEVLLDELGKAAEIRADAGPRRPPKATSSASPVTDVVIDHGLARSQRALQTTIVDGSTQNTVPSEGNVRADRLRPLSPAAGISVYGGAYRARRVDTLRIAFPVLGELIGSELGELALDYLADRPGHSGGPEHFARSFAEWVNEAFRHHRWAHVVRDVLALDTALLSLRTRTGAEAQAPLPATQIRSLGPEDAARLQLPDHCVHLVELSEPSYVRSLAVRAGVALSWSGDPTKQVAIVRRGDEMHAIFLSDEAEA